MNRNDMKASRAIINIIKQFEGFSPNTYICPAGLKTIGYGHVLKKGESFSELTEEQATDLLKVDVNIFVEGLNKVLNTLLLQHEFDALVSFTFNIGLGAFNKSTMKRLLDAYKVDEAGDQFKRWTFAGGRKLPGLVKRRKVEEDIFKGRANAIHVEEYFRQLHMEHFSGEVS